MELNKLQQELYNNIIKASEYINRQQIYDLPKLTEEEQNTIVKFAKDRDKIFKNVIIK